MTYDEQCEADNRKFEDDQNQHDWQAFVLALIMGAIDEAYESVISTNEIWRVKMEVANIAFNGL